MINTIINTTHQLSAPWHKASFDEFLKKQLPQLLARRLPFKSYHVHSTGRDTVSVQVVCAFTGSDVSVEYSDIPQPDAEGVFQIRPSSGSAHHSFQSRVVLPIALQEELEVAEIHCVGEQLYRFIEERLTEAPDDLPGDESLLRTWLPLDVWVYEFLFEAADDFQPENWLGRHSVLRHLRIPDRQRVFTPGHFGRTCPLETPVGVNVGRILAIASGAEIQQGKLVVLDEQPTATLGLAASMIPFLEHSEPRQLNLGIPAMCHWLRSSEAEPALVQTGYEPDVPDFWCGRNLLTAFISWGVDTAEVGIVLSESCAQRLSCPDPVEPGDKLSNRHGSIGVVSRILPDDQMPHLSDGTPVELIFNYVDHQWTNFGQLREAVMGRLARAEEKPAIVPPFHAPSESELQRRLAQAGLPPHGMETLTFGRDGQPLERPSTVGWVYWGCVHDKARERMYSGPEDLEGMGWAVQTQAAYVSLRQAGAWENISEHFNTRAADRSDAATLAARLAAEPIEQSPPPTPRFAELVRCLNVAGIHIQFDGDRLAFSFAPPEGPTLKLACPVPHPWLRERMITEVGVCEDLPAYAALVEANAKARRFAERQTPDSQASQVLRDLNQKVCSDLAQQVRRFFASLLTPAHLRFNERSLFNGRANVVSSADLHLDQIGLPEKIAWSLFGPLVQREIGDANAVRARSQSAIDALDEIMARSWVLLSRESPASSLGFLAFHPVRYSDHAVRLHPLVGPLLRIDSVWNQATVFLPVTAAAQQEAGERLSVAARLAHNADLLEELLPMNEAMWGLAALSLTPAGRAEIVALAGIEITAPDNLITKSILAAALRKLLQRDGALAVCAALERLTRRGFEVARESGASLSPFFGASIDLPVTPPDDDIEMWQVYAAELRERIAARTDFSNHDLGPQLLALKSGAYGNVYELNRIAGAWGYLPDVTGRPVVMRHGHCSGATLEEWVANCVDTREMFARWSEGRRTGEAQLERRDSEGFHVLARTMRSGCPGLVFAHAAAHGEIDPLHDIDSRLFVGLARLGI
ncbi:MAG: hypothetical protein M3347_15300 [Armatimonadota bacterium]|nr:hypothetical protein [Armatimonadota bacterium]